MFINFMVKYKRYLWKSGGALDKGPNNRVVALGSGGRKMVGSPEEAVSEVACTVNCSDQRTGLLF